MDNGKSGGFCELCPGKTARDCIDRAFSNGFGFEECLSVCVPEPSEFITEDFSRIFQIRDGSQSLQKIVTLFFESLHIKGKNGHFIPMHFILIISY